MDRNDFVTLFRRNTRNTLPPSTRHAAVFGDIDVARWVQKGKA